MTKDQYICTLIASGGFSIGQAYSDLISKFFDNGYLTALQGYEAANTRLMSDAGAVISRFSKHAETELEGGRIIAAIGQKTGGATGQLLIGHGQDEQRHHRMFAAMARSVADDFRFEYIDIPERDPNPVINSFDIEDRWKHLICTIHWAEVRNIFILEQYLRSLEISAWDCAKMLKSQISVIFQDEIRHVGYTAQLLEKIILEDHNLKSKSLSYNETYEANCWQEIAEMANYFAENEAVYA